jgi:AraC-like DNA-binding protein
MYRLNCCFLVLLFSFSCTLLAQNKNNGLQKLSFDDLKKGFFDNEKSKNIQMQYVKAFLIKAKLDNKAIQIARGYYLYSLLNDGDESIQYLDSVIKYSKDNRNRVYNFPGLAYFEKAYKLKKLFRFKEAINNFMLAEKIAKTNNDLDFYYNITYAIAILKSEELGEVNEAMGLYKKCFKYYKFKKFKNQKISVMYQEVIFALADAHKALYQTDSSTYYNKIGYLESKITKDEEYKYLFVLNEGANLINSTKYNTALDSIQKALPKMIEYKNVGNTLAAYYYLGKANAGLGKKQLAVTNFIKVDSIYNVTKDMTPEFVSGYHYLIKHYKETNNKEKQLLYITKLMTIDSALNKNYKELTKKLNKEYDIPNLVADKETLILSYQNKTYSYQWLVGLLGLVAAILIGFSYYQNQLKKSYKVRFDELLNFKPEIINSSLEIQLEDKPKIKTETKINEEVVSKILLQLEKLESNNLFLKSAITTQSLAEEIGTNNKYISSIVNEYKSKKFTDYLNDLRINYAIEILKTDTQKRKYTIDALSKEFGFNNAESFSNAFQKRTGLKPSYFIKELDKI